MNAAPLPPSVPLPLPTLGPATLLRALLHRPRASATPSPTALRTVFLLERIDLEHVRRYRAALGFAGDAIPLTWWYLPAQRAQVATLLDPAFPLRLPGTVHVANSLELLGAARPDAPLRLATDAVLHPPDAHGAVVAELATRADQDGRPLFACRSRYLMRRGQPRAAARKDDPASLPAVARWPLDAASGRGYARLSGDWNPIHLWPWSARLLGMRRPVIHGMHTLARACAELERAGGRTIVTLDGRFRAPVALGSEPVLCADLDGGRFVVTADGRTVADGTFRSG